jgi:glutamate 5-kinase
MTDILRQEIATTADTIVVKVGTRVLTREDGKLDYDRITRLGEDISRLIEDGRRVVLVSSGAVGAGIGRLELDERPTDLGRLQAVAAVGQSALVEAYDWAFRRHRHHAAQVLLTTEDLDDRTRYLNARNTLLALMEYGVVPIINENDTISVEELKTTFGDNDRLAAMVTNLIQAPLLVLLSDVEGLYDGDPNDPKSKVIPTVDHLDDSIRSLARDRQGTWSKGGMASKLEAARLTTSSGENVIIASGRREGVLSDIIKGKVVGTLFITKGASMAARKRWIGFTAQPRGHLVLDTGASKALLSGGTSLLPAGVVETVGSFEKGDVIALRTTEGSEFARGLTNYNDTDIRRIMGLQTDAIKDLLGYHPYDEIIHCDNMVLTQ